VAGARFGGKHCQILVISTTLRVGRVGGGCVAEECSSLQVFVQGLRRPDDKAETNQHHPTMQACWPTSCCLLYAL
jgi:hypothetical protein